MQTDIMIEELTLLRAIVGELTANGTSSWESSLRCLACGGYVGESGYEQQHNPGCEWIAWKACRKAEW